MDEAVQVFDAGALSRRDATALVNGLVGPRPIAWVSTVSDDGHRNLAPFSFFNAFSTAPPTLAIGPGSREGENKDSLRNLKVTGELVVNIVDERLAVIANATSGEFPREVDEWEVCGVTPVASETVRPERVGESPAAFECQVKQIVDLGSPDVPTNSVVVATVSRIVVRASVLDGAVPDPDALALVGRMGGDLWARTRDRFELRRPDSRDPAAVLAALDGARGRVG